MFEIPQLAATAIGLVQANAQALQQKKNDEALQHQLYGMPTYKVSDSAKTLLASTRGKLNSLSPAYLASMNMLNQGVTNQIGNAQRNASSGTQALAFASGANSNAMSALPGLMGRQEEYDQRKDQAYQDALKNMSAEEQAAFQSQQDKAASIANYRLGRVGANNANMGQGLSLAATGLLGGSGGTGIGGLNLASFMRTTNWNKPASTLPAMSPDNDKLLPVPSGWYDSFQLRK